MSTSNSPRVKRATAEIHANELGFMASLVSSHDVVQNGRVGGSHQLSSFYRKKKKPKGKQTKTREIHLAGFVSGPSKCV